MTKREPWQDPPVHPAAAMLPMMGDAELDEPGRRHQGQRPAGAESQ